METPKPLEAQYRPTASLVASTLGGLVDTLRTSYLKLGFMHEGQEFAVEVRRLSSAEMDAADAHVRGLVPPVKTKYRDVDFDNPNPELRAVIEARAKDEGTYFGMAALQEKYDYADAGYLQLRAEGQEKQAATLLDFACKGGIPAQASAGEGPATLADKVQWMKANVPDTVLSLLVSKVVEISSRGRIDKASFF